MMRVTTNSTLYTYKRNLLKTTNQLYSAMKTMMSRRNFDSYAADPAAATRAFKVHSSINATNTQYANNTTLLNKFSTAWDVADDMVDKLTIDLAKAPILSAMNATNLSTANTQGDIIFSGAEAMVQSLNSRYDNRFLFNGADTENPPFALEEDGDRTYVTYRGVRIDDPATLSQEYQDENGNTIPNPAGGNYTNAEMLEKWSNEHLYADIGIGFALDENGNVLDSTAFDGAISGTKLIGGFGVDADGDPTNIVSIMVRLSEIFQDFDEETKQWGPAGDQEDAERLLNKFNAAQEELSAQHVALDTQAQFLETNQTQLESTFSSLNNELTTIEQVDQVEAILTLVAMQTSFNAALQVGANVVPQSLMDYLK